MPRRINRFGLSDAIPAEVKRAVRRQAGFGCVSCGTAICQYEHIDPGFAEARGHDPERMAYVCAGCHDKVTRRFWSKAKFEADRRRPWAVRNGRCQDAFDVGDTDVAIWLCNIKCIGVRHILRVNGETLLSIEPPEELGAPYKLSGRFYGARDRLLFEIDRNEWKGDTKNWDIECVGPRLFIRTGPRQIALQLCAVPPRGIVIERLDLQVGATRVQGNREELTVATEGSINNFGLIGACQVIGKSDDTTFINVEGTRQWMGGQGDFSIGPCAEPRPWRRPESSESPCPCGTATPFSKCCGAESQPPTG